MSTIEWRVRKGQLDQAELHTRADAPLVEGQIRVAVERFALTANNITYAAFGDAMDYWQFYPSDEGWGLIPVWGFGSVVQSLHPGVAVGERIYGYFTMASHVVLQPTRLSPAGFMDGAPHRARLHGVYNQLLRCNQDPFYSADTEDVQALLRPLFITSWLIDDFLADNDFFGAQRLIISSASSKTAYGTAFQLAQRTGIELIGLTAPDNVAFCEGLGCYSRVVAYPELEQISADEACVYIDFAGNSALRQAVHSRFAQLRYSSSIGGTHVDQLGGGRDLPGPRPVLFFAPAQIKKRNAEWGADELGRRLVQAWRAFSARVTDAGQPWLQVEQHRGGAAVGAAYQTLLAGRSDPRSGHMLSLWS